MVRSLRSGRPRAAYVGFVGYGNLGDEVLLQAHMELFTGIDLQPYRRSRLLTLRHSVTSKPPYDFGILGGGTLIGQHHRWLEAVESLQAAGVPMFCLGTGVASPTFWDLGQQDVAFLEHSPDEIPRWVKVLKRFIYVGVRGPESQRQLAAWGLDCADVVGDTALSLAVTNARAEPLSTRGIVGVNVRAVDEEPMWGEKQTYLDTVRQFIAALCGSGRQVRLFPTGKRDAETACVLAKGGPGAACNVVSAYDGYAEYARAVSECDVFVGQRLHATIIACMQGVPSLMLEYRPKCRDFMASVGLQQYTVRTDAFTAQIGEAMVNELARRRTEISAQLDCRIGRLRHRQSVAADGLLRHLARISPSSGKLDRPHPDAWT